MLGVLATLLMMAAACSDDGGIAKQKSNTRDGAAQAAPTGALEWDECALELASMAGLNCATLEVPLDRTVDDSPAIDLELARVAAEGDPGERIGSLLLNPGGPGGSGIEFLASAALIFPDEILAHFDLVSWDPRGVGESSPVRCLTDEQKDSQIEGDLSPDDQAELDRALQDQEEFLEGCLTNDPEMLEHMSTADVAGDMEEIREALGDEKLNYVGFSYGTAIGATYATMFPDTVRAMVLDGSVSPTASDLEQTISQAEGFERTYLSFVESCDSDPQCALSGRTASTVDEVRARLDRDPLTVSTGSGDRELTRDLFDIGLATGLYDSSSWGILAEAIADLDGTGGATILSLADRQLGRNPDGTWDNSSDAQTMVNCADADSRPSLEEALERTEEVAEAAPTFGEVLKTSPLTCIDWPQAANPVPQWSADGAPPILVVGTLGDPATPYEWSEQMAAALSGSVLLTYEGDGHTAFLRGGACVNDAVTAYLIDLELPEPGTSCPEVEAPSGMGDMSELLLDQLSQAGIPEPVAQCITERLEEELGAADLRELLLGGDPDALNELVTDITMECMTEG